VTASNAIGTPVPFFVEVASVVTDIAPMVPVLRMFDPIGTGQTGISLKLLDATPRTGFVGGMEPTVNIVDCRVVSDGRGSRCFVTTSLWDPVTYHELSKALIVSNAVTKCTDAKLEDEGR
jgi:hypothetical protein